MTTRQSKMYQARIAEGLCAQCGKGVLVTAIHCQPCREIHNKRMREGYRARNKSGSWKAGGRGRPPLGVKNR